jgi:hypothetical protein
MVQTRLVFAELVRDLRAGVASSTGSKSQTAAAITSAAVSVRAVTA